MTFDFRIENSIFLFPHQDDEYFVSPLVKKTKGNCLCFFLTKGEGRGTPEAIRNRESTKALESLGVPAKNIRFLPDTINVPDMDLQSQLEPVLHWLLKESKGLYVRSIFCPAWEGGHSDHDAAFLLGRALGTLLSATVFEYPMYTGQKIRYPLFRVMNLENNLEITIEHLSFRERFYYALLFRYYPSQWRTWVGLAPFTLWRLITRGNFHVTKADSRILDFKNLPIQKPFYEKRGQGHFADFLVATQNFRSKYL